jgi:hypothetical protein
MLEFEKAHLLLKSQEETSYEENLSYQYDRDLRVQKIPQPFQGKFLYRSGYVSKIKNAHDAHDTFELVDHLHWSTDSWLDNLRLETVVG